MEKFYAFEETFLVIAENEEEAKKKYRKALRAMYSGRKADCKSCIEISNDVLGKISEIIEEIADDYSGYSIKDTYALDRKSVELTCLDVRTSIGIRTYRLLFGNDIPVEDVYFFRLIENSYVKGERGRWIKSDTEEIPVPFVIDGKFSGSCIKCFIECVTGYEDLPF